MDSKVTNDERERDPRTECQAEIQKVLDQHGCALVGVPQFKPDGRGGWYIDVAINIVARTDRP